jgi:aryl-alcohol dehydrogenase-like predicted oxidoreductase
MWGKNKHRKIYKTRPGLEKGQLRETTRRACDSSRRRRLRVDAIDMCYLHRMYPPPIEVENAMAVFKELRSTPPSGPAKREMQAALARDTWRGCVFVGG